MTWKIETRLNWYCIYDEMGWYVAGCQSEQQARLIAKAPQMLETLEAIEERARLILTSEYLTRTRSDWRAVQIQARAAIAAVKGEDSEKA